MARHYYSFDLYGGVERHASKKARDMSVCATNARECGYTRKWAISAKQARRTMARAIGRGANGMRADALWSAYCASFFDAA